MSTVVGVALSTRRWRAELQRHCRDHLTDVAVHLLPDGADGLDGTTHVIIADDDTSWLSGPLVERARDAGVSVLGVFDPAEADGHGQRHLRRIGVDAVLASTIAVEDLVEAIRSHRPDASLNAAFAEMVGMPAADASTRRVLAVGGPAGAGATEVSIELARQMGSNAILIDADETHPSVARRLGLAVHPHIVTAIEAHRREASGFDSDGLSLTDCLAKGGIGGQAPPFDVIAGLASRDDWSLLRPSDIDDLIGHAAQRWSTVVVRVGPQLEDLGRWVERYGASRSVISSATGVVGVCDATAVGVLRFVDWMVDVVPLIGDRKLDIVLNRSPRSVATSAQLADQLREVAGDRIGQIVQVPFDRRVEKAQWEAAPLARGRFTRALKPLASHLVATASSTSAPQVTP